MGTKSSTSQDLLRGSSTSVGASWGSASSFSRFRSDRAKVALIISSLFDRALDWAIAVVGNNPQLSSNLQLFADEFKKTFNHPSNGADAAGRLHSIFQGPRSDAEYTLEFCTLAADSGWDDNALRSAYRRGLSEEIKDILVRDRPSSFNDLVTLALLMDERLQERRLERVQRAENSAQTPGTHPVGPGVAVQGATPIPPLPPLIRPLGEDEPMQLGRLRLSFFHVFLYLSLCLVITSRPFGFLFCMPPQHH